MNGGDGWMNGWMDGWMNGWMDGCVGVWVEKGPIHLHYNMCI